MLQVFLPLNESSGSSVHDYSGKVSSSMYAASMYNTSGSVVFTGQAAHFTGVGMYAYAGVSLMSVGLDSQGSFTFSGFFALDTVVSDVLGMGFGHELWLCSNVGCDDGCRMASLACSSWGLVVSICIAMRAGCCTRMAGTTPGRHSKAL